MTASKIISGVFTSVAFVTVVLFAIDQLYQQPPALRTVNAVVELAKDDKIAAAFRKYEQDMNDIKVRQQRAYTNLSMTQVRMDRQDYGGTKVLLRVENKSADEEYPVGSLFSCVVSLSGEVVEQFGVTMGKIPAGGTVYESHYLSKYGPDAKVDCRLDAAIISHSVEKNLP